MNKRHKVKPDSQVTMNYDQVHDVLYLSLGQPSPSYTDDSSYTGPGRILNRYSMESNPNTTSEYTEPKVTGATIVGYSEIDRKDLIRFVKMAVDWNAVDEKI